MTETMNLAWLVTVRHWKVYRKYFWSNILPTVIEPCFFIISLGIGMAAFVKEIEGLPYATFMGPGLAMSAAMFTAFFESSYGFWVRMTLDGVYKAMFTTPLSPRDVIIGELMWVSLKGAVMSVAVSLIFMAFGFLDITWNLAGVAVVGFFVGMSCGSLGLISSALIENISQFQTVYALVISPLFFFSGNLFPINMMPIALQAVAWISPLYHGVYLAQRLLWQRPDPSMIWHFLALLVSCLVFSLIAYRLAHKKLYN